MSDKVVRDPIHGFQRLRRIRQSGCYTVYPSANHTRFEHSMGVMHLGSRVMETILAKPSGKGAGDLARYELSDGSYKRSPALRKGKPHEYMSCITAHTYASLDNRNGLIEVLNSSADADRLDYSYWSHLTRS